MERDDLPQRYNHEAHVMRRSSGSYRTGNRAVPETPAGRALRSAIDRVLAGDDPSTTALRHGIPEDVLRNAVSEHQRSGGDETSGPQLRGAALRRKLTHEQELEVHALIRSGLPDTLGLNGTLWNRDTVRELVALRTGMVLAQRTLATYLERWGFAPEKPLRSLYRAQPALMREWMRRDYPVIAIQAREVGAQLCWWSFEPMVERRMGKKLVRSSLWPEANWNIMYVVSNRGLLQWVVFTGQPATELLLDLIARVLDNADRPLFLLVHDHPLFATPVFIEWSLRNKHRVIFNLLPTGFTHDRTGSAGR